MKSKNITFLRSFQFHVCLDEQQLLTWTRRMVFDIYNTISFSSWRLTHAEVLSYVASVCSWYQSKTFSMIRPSIWGFSSIRAFVSSVLQCSMNLFYYWNVESLGNDWVGWIWMELPLFAWSVGRRFRRLIFLRRFLFRPTCQLGGHFLLDFKLEFLFENDTFLQNVFFQLFLLTIQFPLLH